MREYKSGLYGPTSYFLAAAIIHGLSSLFYPFFLVAIGFCMWDYTDDSFNNFLNYAFPVMMVGLIGTT